MSACIVCGIDGSSDAARAASMAARLARDLDSRALLVHVADTAGGLAFGLRLPRTGRARRMKKLLKAIAEGLAFPSETEVQLASGDPATELMAVAEREDAELVVVSAHGGGKISPALLGGVASALMRRCPCPVVVVPPRAIPPLDAEGMKRVVCGVKGRDTDVRVLRLAGDLAARLGADLHAVHSYDPGTAKSAAAPGAVDPLEAERRDAAEGRLALILAEAGVEARARVLALPTADALERVAGQERAGLTVVGSPEGSAEDVGLGRSAAIRLAAGGTTALVVLPAEAELGSGTGHYELAAGTA
jgi:nucleotide-binding universal stress UspA family protein